MKRPNLNIALGTLFGAGIAGAAAVALAGWSWLWFGLAIGTAGGWAISKCHYHFWYLRKRRQRTASFEQPRRGGMGEPGMGVPGYGMERTESRKDDTPE